jgi:hypothetical protein
MPIPSVAHCLVSKAGFEPAATRFQGEDSTRLSYSELVLVTGLEPVFPWVKTTLPIPISRHKLKLFGAESRNRTQF